MYNEEHREKMVFEDFAFDTSDKDELARREAETARLIKEGKLPEQKINGEIVVHMRNFENIMRVDGKPLIMFKAKRSYFKEDATVAFRTDIYGFIDKKLNWEEGLLNTKINVKDLLNQNLHMQGDTILVQLFCVEEKNIELRKTATFVGEIRVKYKHCFDEDAKNNWQHQQVEIVDEENKMQKRVGDEIVTA